MLKQVFHSVYRIYLVIRNWLFQSYLYVERTEFVFKLFFELAVLAALVPFLLFYFSRRMAILIGMMISHTISWIFNGDIHVLRKCIGFASRQPLDEKLSYLEGVCVRASTNSSIRAVGIVGSAARGEMTSTSDIDIRLVRNSGVEAGIGACLFLLKERFNALCLNIPFDCYLYDDLEQFQKDAENPVILDYNCLESNIEGEFEKIIKRNQES